VPVVADSFAIPTWDQTCLFLSDHWHRACLDPFGYAFWGVIWSFAFAATFLLLRMFFTGWGDKNVTEKTLALSILLHVLLAMLSTTVMLRQDEAPRQELRTRIRRVVVGDSSQTATGTAAEIAGRPRWDLPSTAPIDSRERVSKKESSTTPVPVRERELLQPADLPLTRSVAETEVVTSREPLRVEIPVRTERPDLNPMIEREATATRRREADQSDRRSRIPDSALDEETMPLRGPRQDPANAVDFSGSPDPGMNDIESGPVPTMSPLHRGGDSSRQRALPNSDGMEMPTPKMGVDRERGGSESQFSRTGRAGRGDSSLEGDGRIRRLREQPGPVVSSPEDGPSAGNPLAGVESVLVVPEIVGSPDIRGNGRTIAGKIPEVYRLRQAELRGEAARSNGATQDSEQAVAASLAWLADQQLASGAWPMLESVLGEDPEPTRFTEKNDPDEESRQKLERSQSGLQAESGVTALAILAFLGAGHTAEDPAYGRTVSRGLKWLVSQQVRTRPQDNDTQKRYDGFLGGKANRFARMYCHGMATIALGEAYGMTRDPELKEPLEKALRYVVRMQYPDGSWRYSDWQNQRNATGDMSLFGWQVMALKSGQTAGIELPNKALEKALDRARQYLVSRRNEMRGRDGSRDGGVASYRPGERPRPAMTAESLFCWQLLGVAPNDPAVLEAVDSLRRNPPRLATQDIYYWYYATLAMFHHGGVSGTEWTTTLQETLVSSQRQEGDEKGSWDPRRPWGDYGGRIFSTAMSTLCLEVYYRYLPMYREAPEKTEVPPERGKGAK